MKKLLLLFLFITAFSNAQNSISIVTIPTEVNQGATFDITFEYTSATAGMYELQFIPMNAEGQPVWSMGNAFFVSNPISATAAATSVTASITLPADIALTSTLTSPAVAWGVFGKITDGTADTAYLSPYPLVSVIAGETSGEASAGSIAITNFPSEVSLGSTFDVTFEYTSNFVGTYELQFMPMDADGQPVWSLGNSFFASAPIAINATATQITVPVTIPNDIALSSNLESPAVAWGLFGKIADDKADVAYLSPYPQTSVVATLGVRNTIFDSKTIFYNSSQNTLEINLDKITATSLQIYDLTGKIVLESEVNSSIDVSSLSSGIYIVKSQNKFLKFIK